MEEHNSYVLHSDFQIHKKNFHTNLSFISTNICLYEIEKFRYSFIQSKIKALEMFLPSDDFFEPNELMTPKLTYNVNSKQKLSQISLLNL